MDDPDHGGGARSRHRGSRHRVQAAVDALFVYGSLRSDAGGPMHARLAVAGRLVGGARVRGRLFAVDWYPGLVLGDEAWVRGELWALDDSSALYPLDAYEGCGDDDWPPHEFVRARTLVHLDEGATHEAWVYVYHRATHGLDVVASGDWLITPARAGAIRRSR